MMHHKNGYNAGIHRSQALTKARRREPKPCIPVKAASTSLAWAPEASEAIDINSNTPASLADVADELLRSERRKKKDETYSPSAERLQEQLALQLEEALKAHDGVHTLSSAQLLALKVTMPSMQCADDLQAIPDAS